MRKLAAMVVVGGALVAGCGSDADDRDKGSLESQQATQAAPALAKRCKTLKGAAKIKCNRRLKQLQALQRQAP